METISSTVQRIRPKADFVGFLSERIKTTSHAGPRQSFTREFTSDCFPDSRLTLTVSDAGLTVALSQSFLPRSDGRTEQFSFFLSDCSENLFSFRYSCRPENPDDTFCDCGNGIFRADTLIKASSLAFSKVSIEQSPSCPLAVYERTVILYESRACQAAKRALALLDAFLLAEHLGFTTANLGFRY